MRFIQQAKWSSPAGRVATRRELAAFTRQLATLLKAGMPVVRALDVLARQQARRRFRSAIAGLAEAIRAGGTLSDALARHPGTFDRLYVNMVKAGEAGGASGMVLERLATFIEKSERIRGRVISALTYPAIILVVAFGIVTALMVFVVPRFQDIFAGMLKGQPLPGLTQAVLLACSTVRAHPFAVLGLVGGMFAAQAGFRRSRPGRRATDWLLIRLPVVGGLFLKSAVAQFARTLATLLAGGVPILRALAIARDTAGNVWVAAAVGHVQERVKAGETVARPLAATGIFPAMVSGMIEVGEETGALPEMLGRIADAYEEEVDTAVAGLTAIIEPVMIVGMALLVGTIVIALFLPIVRIVQLMS